MITSDNIAKVYAFFIDRHHHLLNLSDQENVENEIVENLNEHYEYLGKNSQEALKGYYEYGYGLSFNKLIAIMHTLEKFHFEHLGENTTVQTLSLVEWLSILTNEEVSQIQKLHGIEEVVEFTTDHLTVLKKVDQQLHTIYEDVIALRVQEFLDYHLECTAEELHPHAQMSRETYLSLLFTLKLEPEHQKQQAAYLSILRKQSIDLFREKARKKASEMERQAQASFKQESVKRLRQSYPKMSATVPIDTVVDKFMNKQPKFFDTHFRPGQRWQGYAEKLATHYSKVYYSKLLKHIKREVFKAYGIAVGLKAQAAAAATGVAIAGMSDYVAQRLIMFTPVRVVMDFTKGVTSVTASAAKALNKHILQRGVRAYNMASELVEAETNSYLQKKKGGTNPKIKNDISSVILGDIVSSPDFHDLVEDSQRSDMPEEELKANLQTTVESYSGETFEQVDTQGVAYIQQRLVTQNIETLIQILLSDLDEFHLYDGLQFDESKVCASYIESLNRHYSSVLQETSSLNDDAVIEELVRGVGYRVASQHILECLITEEEENYIQGVVDNLYEKKSSTGIEVSVTKEEFLLGLQEDGQIVAVKSQVPLQLGYSAAVKEKIEAYIVQEFTNLPAIQDTSQTAQMHDTVEELYRLAADYVLQVQLADSETVYQLTRHPIVWAISLGDSQDPDQALSADTAKTLENLTKESKLLFYDMQKESWVSVNMTTILANQFNVISTSEIAGARASNKLLHKYTDKYYAHYIALIKKQGFKIHSMLEDVQPFYAVIEEAYEHINVPFTQIEEFVSLNVQNTLKSGVEHVLYTQYDADLLKECTARYFKEHQIQDVRVQGEISGIIFNIPVERFKQCKKIFDLEGTREAFYATLVEHIDQVSANNLENGRDRYAQATTQIQRALKQIKGYTRQDKQVYEALLNYAHKLQQSFNNNHSKDAVKVRVNEDHSLIEVALENRTEIFIFHPQFIFNAISHKVYADRTGVITFDDSFTSDLDAILERDIQKLSSLITARRQTDYEQKELTDNDHKRLLRFHQILKVYGQEFEKQGISLVMYSKDNAPHNIRVLVKGLLVYVFNPIFFLEVPTNRFLYKRQDEGATIADMQEQFLSREQLQYLSTEQFKLLKSAIILAFDLRRKIEV